MKRTQLKKYLIFMVILFSLTVLFSCKSDEPTTAKDEYKVYERIENDELVKFIMRTYPFYPGDEVVLLSETLTSPAAYVTLPDMYFAAISDSRFKIKEYRASNEEKMIACYAPCEAIEEIFGYDMSNFASEHCSVYLFKEIVSYLNRTDLSYRDLGLYFCYVDREDLRIINCDEALVYLGSLTPAKSVDGDVTVCRALSYYVNEDGELIFLPQAPEYLGKSILKTSVREDKFLSPSDFGEGSSCKIENLNGIEIVRVTELLTESFQAEYSEFFHLTAPALVSSEELFTKKGALYGYVHIYNYDLIKEILPIVPGGAL